MRQRWRRLCLQFFSRAFRRSDTKQAAAQVQLLLPMAVGEQAIMTDAMETVRNRMQQETANELVGLKRHYLLPAARSIILPSECDAIAIDADEAGIGDGNAMRVAAEISQHLRGSSKGRLGIDDPVDAPRFFDNAIECGRIGQVGDVAKEPKLAQIISLLQFFEKQSSKQARQNPHGQEEVCPAGDPSGLVE